MESPDTTNDPIEEERRRWELAQAIVDENTGPMKKVVTWTKRNPEAALSLAFAAGLLIGFAVRRD